MMRLIGLIVPPIIKAFTYQDWRNAEGIPRTGGVVVAVNHLSYFDPLAFGHFLIWAGRWPRYLAKAALFKAPIIGFAARNSGQIPVFRGSARAADSIGAATAAIRAGRAVCVYPEGSVTSDPKLWPMRPKSGAARIALAAGCPVIPVGQWGAHKVMPGKKPGFPRLLPKKTMQMMVGDPIDLDDLRAQPLSQEVIVEANARIMAAIVGLVAELREETPPATRWNPETDSYPDH